MEVVFWLIALIWLGNIYSRVSKLEKLLGVKGVDAKQTATRPSSALPTAVPLARAAQTGPTSGGRFIAWLKEDWLLKLGALLLIIGFGWFASYAFLHNWIGPAGRIALGIVAGAGILLFGWWRMKRLAHQGGVFLVLGSTVILLTTFAAREMYDFFTPGSALVIMFLSTALVALASVKYQRPPLALASLVLAGIAPFFTNAPTPDYVSLFWYLLIVILGAIWVTAITGQRALTTAALILFFLYSLSHLFLSVSLVQQPVLLLFAYAFAAIFFITNILAVLKSKDIGKGLTADLLTAGVNGLLLLAWIISAAPEEWQSLIIAGWMIVFVAGAFVVFRNTKRREPFFIYAGVGLAMLAAATAVELNGAALTIAYTLESALVILITHSLVCEARVTERTGWLLLGPVVLSLESFTSNKWTSLYYDFQDVAVNTWVDRVLHLHFFVLLVLALTLFGLWAALRRQVTRLSSIVLVGGSVYALALLWLSLHAALSRDVATMISLSVYTVVGLVTYFYGKSEGRAGTQKYGRVLVLLVIARLFLVDVWDMALTGRIITFFLVGILLVGTAFIGRKKQAAAAVLIFFLVGTGAKATETAETISAFRSYKDVSEISITVPTVVEVPFRTDESLERFDFAVLDTTVNKFEPWLFKPASEDVSVGVRATSVSGEANGMIDHNLNTYTEFVLPQDRPGETIITVTADRPITSSALTLRLDNYVALPTSIAIYAETEAGRRAVVVRRRMYSETINFPKTTARTWEVALAYAQPLRIVELALAQEQASGRFGGLRFLAEPKHSYKIYFSPDRYVEVLTGEAADLFSDREIKVLSAPATKDNLEYVQADVDKDGIPDATDNCVKTINADQKDEDSNGRGDVCDDFDRDGVINSKDNCLNRPNTNQTDTDGDEIGDVCDEQESRLTERYKWFPWIGIGFAALVLIVLFSLTAKSMRGRR